MRKDEKHTVIQKNVLLESRFRFSLLELKLTLSVISQIKRGDKDFKNYRVYIQEFIESTKIFTKNYDQVRRMSKRLKRKDLEFETETGHLQTSYFSDIETFRDRGYIEFTVSPKMKPFLLQLRENFTIYDIRNILQCRSVHSIRIYQLLKQYEKIGERTISLDDLKAMLGLENQYPRWTNFKTRILEVSRRELKRKSDLFFEYEPIKQGRKIHSIRFKIHKQRQKRLFDREDQDLESQTIVDITFKKTAQKLKELAEAEKESVSLPKELKKKLEKHD